MELRCDLDRVAELTRSLIRGVEVSLTESKRLPTATYVPALAIFATFALGLIHLVH
jgi:hypothetical protein